MRITKVSIKKFRGFHDVEFELGKHITVIAGQNGTQKTTVLGILSQTFSLKDEDPMRAEKPLSGGNYISAFSDKFKLSPDFDKPKGHEWTLYFDSKDTPEFTVESIKRDDSPSGLRFWKKSDKTKGSGYMQLPVIYLSLSRLLPLGEDGNIEEDAYTTLSNEEYKFYKTWHDKILIITDSKISKIDYLASKQKNTLGVTTDKYDWKMISAGQDNLGKILLAVLSFKRLKDKYPEHYNGGILVIDEIDATLYPASQVKLFDAIMKFASDYNIQFVFTTHSLSILEHASETMNQKNRDGQINLVYLEKCDNSVRVINGLSFDDIRHRLNISLGLTDKSHRLPVFFEDKEAEIFFKGLVKQKIKNLKYISCSLGCTEYIRLAGTGLRGFVFPDSLIILDGDIKSNSAEMRKINKLKNIVFLPSKMSPEQLIATHLLNLSDSSELWSQVNKNYSKQHVFKNCSYEEIMQDRVKSKAWFNEQKKQWGRGCSKVINHWIDANREEYDDFILQVEKTAREFSKALLINLL